MLTFDHTDPKGRRAGNRRPAIFPAVVLGLCALALLPLTLLGLLAWALSPRSITTTV
jgi:hypothetical protein